MKKPAKFGILVFPGSNCDHDAYAVVKNQLNHHAEFIWHKDEIADDIDVVILPGGFSYGDYLRAGAIAQFSPVMKSLQGFASAGGLVIGICNGFQVLCEAGLLPGALTRNHSLRFVSKNVHLKVEHNQSKFTNVCKKDDVLEIPIAHGEGNYFASTETIDELEKHNQILLRYCTPAGEVTNDVNPNGSINNIAGIVNKNGNVFGLMPHPERCAEALLGNEDGLPIFHSILSSLGF